MKKHHSPRLAKYSECTGCLACVDTCGVHALKMHITNDGHLYPLVDTKKCMGCKACEKVCPIRSGLEYSKSEISTFYAAWNNNSGERKGSASGGAFSAIAHYVIDNGGVVIGAKNENVCDVKHDTIYRTEELSLLQGSKYTQSVTVGIYTQTLKLLQNGTIVLFSGTGCQIAGLYSFLRNKKYLGTLITVDLICGGVPSKLLLQKFVEKEPYKVNRIISYRTKDTGWESKGFLYNMKVEDSEGTIHDYKGIRNLVTTAFGVGLTQRYSCYNCKFVGKQRMSDFTIGDLWGDDKYPQEHFAGLSLLIAHNKQSEELLTQMESYLHVEPYDGSEAIKNNHRLINGENISKYTLERKFLAKIFSCCSYKTLKKIYANDYPNVSIWMLLKIGRYVYLKILNLILRNK